MGLILRQGNTGEIFRGESDGDVLLWHAASGEWQPGAGGASLPAGDYEGQLLYWDGAAWVPVPTLGGPTARAEGFKNLNDSDPCSLALGDGTISMSGATAQLQSRDGNLIIGLTQSGSPQWQMAFADGSTFTQILGDTTTIALTANTAGGTITLTSHAVLQTMGDGWQVSIGEGADFVAIDAVIGFLVQVEPGLTATLQNATGCQYQIQDESHVFRTPDSVGAFVNNLQLSHSGDAPTVGFLGAGPVVRQSIAGATTQEQIDSLVAAGVALGLWTDDR